MSTKNCLHNLKTYQKTTAIIIGLVTILSLALTLIQPLEYRSSCQLLIIQKNNPGLDAYAAARSAESLSENLSKVIYTSSFFDKVMNSDFSLRDNFSKDEAKRRSQWRKKITAQISRETGMLKIDVYDKDKAQAEEFSRAVAYILSVKGGEYHGGGEHIEIKLVDAPLTSRFPVRPNFFFNIFTGLILGIMAGGGYIAINSKSEIQNPRQVLLSRGIPHASKDSGKEENSTGTEFKNYDLKFKKEEITETKERKNIKTEEQGNELPATRYQLPVTRKIFTMYDFFNDANRRT